MVKLINCEIVEEVRRRLLLKCMIYFYDVLPEGKGEDCETGRF